MPSFFEISRDLHCLAGLDGYLKQVNSSFIRTLGYSEIELLAHPYAELVHVDDIVATLAGLENLSRGEPTVQFSNRYRKRDGAWCRLEWTVVRCLTEGLIYATARNADDRIREEKSECELEIARQIQQRLYPDSFPEHVAFEAAGEVVSVDRLCGDCLDVALNSLGESVFVLGDVSGHGLPAALQMVELRSLLRVLLQHHDLGDALTEVRRMTLPDFAMSGFVTLFMVRIDVNRQLLQYIGAGHDAWIVRADKTREHLPSTAAVLGLDDEPSGEATVRVATGDVLLLTTDGVAEAGVGSGEPFGITRALDIVCEFGEEPVTLMLHRLIRAIKDHARQSLTDDATVALVKIL